MAIRTEYIELDNGDIIAVYKAEVVKPKEKRAYERTVTQSCLQDLLNDQTIVLEKAESGAPFVEGSEWDISISHSGPWYAFHLAKGHNAGIDVQIIKDRSLETASSYFVSEREKQLELNHINLHLIWCAKEAIYKFTKGTLEDDRESAVVTQINSDKIIMDFEGEPITCQYFIKEGYILVFMHI